MTSEGEITPDIDRFEALRCILEDEQGRNVDIAEAQEVGESLVDFFETLAADVAQQTEAPAI